jgi:hypothetical protein
LLGGACGAVAFLRDEGAVCASRIAVASSSQRGAAASGAAASASATCAASAMGFGGGLLDSVELLERQPATNASMGQIRCMPRS